jgi:hypothetical protein
MRMAARRRSRHRRLPAGNNGLPVERWIAAGLFEKPPIQSVAKRVQQARSD